MTTDVEIEAFDAGGNGIARHGGRTLVVPFTLPGERVRVTLGVPRAEATPAIVEAVLRPSPHRIAPRCRHFGPAFMRRPPDDPDGRTLSRTEIDAPPCGGCAWQHIDYQHQLRLKTELVTRLVRAEVPQAPAAKPTLPGAPVDAPWGYRHKVHFVFGSAPRPVRGGPCRPVL